MGIVLISLFVQVIEDNLCHQNLTVMNSTPKLRLESEKLAFYNTVLETKLCFEALFCGNSDFQWDTVVGSNRKHNIR